MNQTQWWPATSSLSEFVAPPTIISGRGSTASIGQRLAANFAPAETVVLVAVDDIVLTAGLASPLIEGLKTSGFTVHVQSGFGSEPNSEVVDAAATIAREARAQVVIGIGGGSVLDSSKILALLLRNEGTTADWIGAVVPPNGVAPLILIPTTCGTGAEATRIAMVTVAGAKRASSCAQYVPSIAIIDPDLVATLPRSVVAATGMDALAHAIESIMSTSRSPVSAHHAMRAIELLSTHLEDAANGDDDARAACLWASHLAGQALNAGVVVGHSLAYCMAYSKPMPHGTSCALALPYTLAYNRSMEPELAKSLALALTASEGASLRDAAERLIALSQRLGLPTTLTEAGIVADEEAGMAARLVAEYPRPTNPVSVTESGINALFVAMRTGDLDAAFAVTP